MNATEITYGIEIECVLPGYVVRENGIEIGGHHRGRQVPGLPTGWTAERDGSVESLENDGVPVEIVSPKLVGLDGLKQISQVAAKLNQWGATVNRSCGFHVHVGWSSNSLRALRRLVHLAASFQPAIFAAAGDAGRQTSAYCKGIREAFRHLHWGRSVRRLGYAAGDRYHLLNLENLVNSRKPTVEFRAFAGTLDAGRMIAYVRLCVGLVERAHAEAKLAKWDKAPSKWSKNAGPGCNEVLHMVFSMGWRGKWQPRTYGAIAGDGVPSMEESAAKLELVARMYDTHTGQ